MSAVADAALQPAAHGAAAQLPSSAAVLDQAHAENFPVALALLGPRVRRQLMAIYGFARLVDDIGDEADGDRLALLDDIEAQLDAPTHPLMRRIVATIRDCQLPREPFLRLIEANRRDQQVSHYRRFDQLLDYCQLSAAPVGELVLHVFGAATPERIGLSDHVCAALQVIEHLQDIDEDAAKGRVYIGEFGASTARAQAHELLKAGPPLVRSLSGRARLAVAGFLAGGRTALAELETGAKPSFARAYLKAVAGR